MSFDWSEYLELSRGLARQAVGSASQEVRLRTAISRAYYVDRPKHIGCEMPETIIEMGII